MMCLLVCGDFLVWIWGNTALADAGVEDFGEDFVASWDWNGVVGFKLDVATEGVDQGDGLGLRDGNGAHHERRKRVLLL